MCPWKLLATPDAYIFGWLVGYSGLLGPVAGIMVCDYFFIRGTELDVNSLYHSRRRVSLHQGRESAGDVGAGAGSGDCARWACLCSRCIFSMTTRGLWGSLPQREFMWR